jgi:hypothetical protein
MPKIQGNHMQEDRLTYASKFIYIAHAYVCMVCIYYKSAFFHLNGQEMEYIHLTPVDGTSILQLYCFMHRSSTCGMYVTMLFAILMIHIIHVFPTICMAHIVKWEQIVLMGMWAIWCIWWVWDTWHFLCMWDMCYICGWDMWDICCRCWVWDI